MLVPAILYKDELEKLFAAEIYSDDYFYYTGWGTCFELPNLDAPDDHVRWAIIEPERTEHVDKTIFDINSWTIKTHPQKVIGYFAYQINPATDTVCNFGLYSFDRGNPIIGVDVFSKMKELIRDHQRIEWRLISGNPIKTDYDKLCMKYHGNRIRLHNICKDNHGRWHNEYIYEIVKNMDFFYGQETDLYSEYDVERE